MKPRLLLGILLCGISAATLSADTSSGYPPKTPPATKPAAKDSGKKEEPMGTIEGTEIKRGAGYMGIAVVNGNFKLTFYDAKKKPVPVPPEVARASLRWSTPYQQKDERAVLNPTDDGKTLTSAKTVKPPLNFRLFISLQAVGSEEGVSEGYSIEFRG